MVRSFAYRALLHWLTVIALVYFGPLPIEQIAAQEPEQYVIDYAVFYTPAARANEGDGTVAAMESRIATAFDRANEIFRDSQTGIQLRLISAQELSINNSGTALDTVISELSGLPEMYQSMLASNADSRALIVEQMLPGAYAGIPLNIGQARAGGFTFFGRLNFSGFTLAHETGHTLGAFHDVPADGPALVNFAPAGPHANHFVGNSGQHWRTVMSVKLYSYRAPEGVTIPTLQSNRFSNPAVIWDGVPTGIVGQSDVVSTFRYYAPFVSQAGELRSNPQNGGGEPAPPEEPPPLTPLPPGDFEGEGTDTPAVPKLSLLGRPAKSRSEILVRGRCRNADNSGAATGEKIELGSLESGKLEVIRRVSCSSKGVATFKIAKRRYKKGLIMAYRSHPQVRVKVPFIRTLVR